MNGKKAKQIRKLVFMGMKPVPSFIDDKGTLQVDMVHSLYRLVKKNYNRKVGAMDLIGLIPLSRKEKDRK